MSGSEAARECVVNDHSGCKASNGGMRASAKEGWCGNSDCGLPASCWAHWVKSHKTLIGKGVVLAYGKERDIRGLR